MTIQVFLVEDDPEFGRQLVDLIRTNPLLQLCGWVDTVALALDSGTVCVLPLGPLTLICRSSSWGCFRQMPTRKVSRRSMAHPEMDRPTSPVSGVQLLLSGIAMPLLLLVLANRSGKLQPASVAATYGEPPPPHEASKAVITTRQMV